jgi:hypothetical protein
MKAKIFVIILLITGLLLAACGQAATPQEITFNEAVEAPAEMEAMVAPAGKGVEGQADLAAEAPAAEAPVAAAPPVPAGSGGFTDILPQDTGRMVIKDAVMELLVNNTDRAVNEVTELAATQGGYIINARSWYDGEMKYANIRMGVPSANFERTLTFLRALGVQVLNETASGQDVSAEYNDLQARLLNLEATAARVRAFLEDAKTVEESLRINATLSDLEGQIEQVKGQMKFYEGRSAFSTIDVTLNPVRPTPTITPTPLPTATPTPWNPGATISQASQRGIGLWQDILDGLIWVCFLAWPLLLVGGLIWLIVWLVRRNRKAKAAPPAPVAPPQEE